MFWYEPFFCIPVTRGEGGKRLSAKRLAKYRNDFIFRNTWMELVTDALNRYKIDGLPETCSERVVLQSLLWYGTVVFVEKNGSVLSLPGGGVEGTNIYGDWGYAWAYALNGIFNEKIELYLHGSDKDDFIKRLNTSRFGGKYMGVMIRENPMCYPFIFVVQQYAEDIADTIRMLEVMRKNLKHPYIITAEESVVPTVKEYFDRRDNNEEYIVSSGIFPADRVNVLPLTINGESINSATSLIDWYHNHFKVLCGLSANTNADKKGENLLTGELEEGGKYAKEISDKVLESLNRGLEDCNKIFGTDMKAVEKEYKNADENILPDRAGDGDGDSLPVDNPGQR